MRRWFDIDESPSSRAVMEHRRGVLHRAGAAPVRDRVAYIAELCSGKRVLDIGCVNHVARSSSEPSWLHRHICQVGSYCLGVDIVEEGVKALVRAGYNVRRCDITREPLEDLFDVIIAGEVIGHLDHPMALFQAARRNLLPGGRLVVTTPNPFYINHMYRGLRNNGYWSPDIIALMFPSGMVEMSERAGLNFHRWRGVSIEDASNYGTSIKLRALRWMRPMLLALGMKPEALCPTMIYEFEQPNGEECGNAVAG